MTNENKIYYITEGTCNGEEKQFAEWVKQNYPEFDVEYHLSRDGLYINNDRDEDFNDDLWDQYCNSWTGE